MKVIEEEPRVHVIDGPWSPIDVIKEVVEAGQEDPFYVMDLGQVVARYHQWKELMPRVEPFYAVKCNDDPLLLRTLAALGTGFDCASKAEIELISSMGVRPERIIFANPAKMASHIRHAAAAGVTTMTFDSETELLKVKQCMPHAQLVIRIRCDAATAQCPLGIKFGCDPVASAPRLLKLAAVLGLEVVGVSFHVGSGASETGVYARGVQYCGALFAFGATVGHRMRLLDLGGGFPGHKGSSIAEVSAVINGALELHFPDRRVQVIAEPGRYFAAAAYTLAAMVHAKREIATAESTSEAELSGAEGEGEGYGVRVGEGQHAPSPAPSESHTMYFINDGVYGSFNCVLYDHQTVEPRPLHPSPDPLLPCSVWGPSCDGLDCVVPATRLPPLPVGAWLTFSDMGAYTLPVASPFNGFPVPAVRHYASVKLWNMLKELWPLSETRVEFSPRHTPPPSPPHCPAPSPALAVAAADLASALATATVFVECALK